ncbi:hypothetical protein KJ877_05485 [bacterium]|nr:hypothetical protein [bacterium]MBU1990484.1 hypothetical protein [bacterium]
MIKITLLTFALLFFTACVNRHGISAKYYSDCEEYYDLQGYYHKKCGDDDIVTYKEIGEATGKVVDAFTGKKEQPKGNVW